MTTIGYILMVILGIGLLISVHEFGHYLCARLIHGGFQLLDTQFVTDHLRQFGTVEIDRAQFHALLEKALARQASFGALPADAPPEQILEIVERQR